MKEDQVTQGTGEQPRDGLMDQILRNLSSKLLFHGQKKQAGLKCIIGDNLTSHLSMKVIQRCEELHIKFVFLSANTTHLCQLLDVVCLAPVKKEWRSILTDYNMKHPHSVSLNKLVLPILLDKINPRITESIKSGFRTVILIIKVDKVTPFGQLTLPTPLFNFY